MNQQDDEELFRRELGDVKPLKVESRVRIRREEVSELALKARREAAAARTPRERNFLSTAEIPILDPHYPLEFKREGIQHGVFRKLKQGRYQLDARLDLHRLHVEQARKEVFSFIQEAAHYDLRTVMIVHGKGSHTGSNAAILKSYVNHWLPQLEQVQAFVSAQPRHGGVGAVYVLLRKSERKKQENRERYGGK